MENKVLIDLKEYETLKSLEKSLKESNQVFYEHYSGMYYSLSKDELIDKLKKNNKSLNVSIEKTMHNHHNLQRKVDNVIVWVCVIAFISLFIGFFIWLFFN
jgi:aconitase B